MSRDEKVALDRIVLRRWDPKKDKQGEGIRSKKPVYVIYDLPLNGASYAHTPIEAASVFAQNIANRHKRRVQLVCDPDSVEEDLYYTADFMVDHHNTYMDAIDPVMDDNPFGPRGVGGRIPQHIPTLRNEGEIEAFDKADDSDTD